MKCIIVDDEPFALDLIKGYVEKTQILELQGIFLNPVKALSFLMQNNTDLIFLDINMPELNGMQFLKALSQVPSVIFTTAYSEFGAESYDFNAVDYLLKPIKYERFLKAVSKAFECNGKTISLNSANEPEKHYHDNLRVEHDYIHIKSGSKIHLVKPESIHYVEASGNYMIFHTSTIKILSLMTMRDLLSQLPKGEFIRVHKSYVVSVKLIDVIERFQLTIKGNKIPIGLTYREDFFSKYQMTKI